MFRDPATIRIRRARPDECGTLSRIARAAKGHWGYPTEALVLWRDQLTVTEATIAAHTVRVAVDEDDRPIGFYALERRGAKAELGHLWVDPTRHGRGVGRRLVEHAIDEGRRGGARSLGIDSDPHAEGFYRRLGARRVGEIAAPLPDEPGRMLPRLELSTVPVAPSPPRTPR